MLEIFGIPTSKDEDTKGIVCKLASLATMLDFSKDVTDVVHRTSSKPVAPITVLCYKNSDWNKVFEQRYKMKTLRSSQFSDDAVVEQHLESNGEEPTQKIYINESLTKENRELLKLAREAVKETKCKCKGYTVEGEVRVRKNDSND